MSIKKFKGFTLIEILVATGIFVAVMVVLSQVYLAIIRSERVAYGLLNAENNIRNNLEVIARSLRMGKNFESIDNGICFDYYLDNNNKWKEICYQYNAYNIEQYIEGQTNDFKPLFDPNLKITKANFYIIKLDSSQEESQITIVISLEVETPSIKNQVYTFHLQTAVTPRILITEEI